MCYFRIDDEISRCIQTHTEMCERITRKVQEVKDAHMQFSSPSKLKERVRMMSPIRKKDSDDKPGFIVPKSKINIDRFIKNLQKRRNKEQLLQGLNNSEKRDTSRVLKSPRRFIPNGLNNTIVTPNR